MRAEAVVELDVVSQDYSLHEADTNISLIITASVQLLPTFSCGTMCTFVDQANMLAPALSTASISAAVYGVLLKRLGSSFLSQTSPLLG